MCVSDILGVHNLTREMCVAHNCPRCHAIGQNVLAYKSIQIYIHASMWRPSTSRPQYLALRTNSAYVKKRTTLLKIHNIPCIIVHILWIINKKHLLMEHSYRVDHKIWVNIEYMSPDQNPFAGDCNWLKKAHCCEYYAHEVHERFVAGKYYWRRPLYY